MTLNDIPEELFEYTSDVDETVTGIVRNELIESEEDAGVVVLTGDRPGRAYRVSREITIGRAPDNDVNIRLPDVSRRHARICALGRDGYWLEDLDSHNGTTVNGEPIRRRALVFGDRITIGKNTMLLFTQHDPIEERLRQRQRVEMIGRLASGIAHDFNNLLGTITTNVNYLTQISRSQLETPGDFNVVLDDIKIAVKRASEMTKKLLVFARPTPYQDQRLDLAEVIQETAGITQRTFGSKFSIEREVGPDVFVCGDGSQMHQLLMNLIINARDAMPDGGRIRVSARKEVGRAPHASPGLEASVVIKVADSGQGMDAATQARLFEPFFTTKPQGTGLGLATAARIVDEHGGDISVESSPQRGCTFTIVLPAASAVESLSPARPNMAAMSASAHARDARGATKSTSEIDRAAPSDHPEHPEHAAYSPISAARGLRILLVDDEDLQLRGSKRLLEECGHSVIPTRSGAEALATFNAQREELDLAMLDIMMPGMSGIEVCRAIKQKAPDFHVLGLSACTDIEKLREMESAGAEALLYKPFTPEALEAAIREVIAT
ncbi:MAG: response regulator [Deltaproteobacteria bacterium]|nr:response regulator [Deltaproteobacteria bacterium]